MNTLQTESITQLPLSWARTDSAEPVFNLVDLPFTSPGWIPTAEIPQHYSFDQVYREHLSQMPQGFVLQNCSLDIRDYLLEQGCQVAAMGAEAVLELPWRGKRSVRELARRGRRHGTIHEVELNRLNQLKLAKLIRESSSRQGVQLRYTERPDFDTHTRCIVFETAEQQWLGAITLSIVNPHYVHTEMLLRHPKAPTGIMEALVSAIAQQLAQAGVRQLSLGCVTPLPPTASDALFARHRHPQERWLHSQLAFRLGRAFNFAYSADGLWHFKNKFSPQWQPLYLCASPRLTWPTVLGLIQATGYFDLVRSQLREAWPNAMLERSWSSFWAALVSARQKPQGI